MTEVKCGSCEEVFTPRRGRGRPRKFCETCVPPGTGAEAIRAWRDVNPQRVAAYNKSRRVVRWNPYRRELELRAGSDSSIVVD
jgi:hypothetical protein